MSTPETMKKLEKLFKKIRPNLEAAGLSEQQITKFTIKAELETDATIEKYIDDVTALTIKGGAYHEFMGIYGLRSPEWWVNMAMFGGPDLREHVIRRQKSKLLISAWKDLHREKAKAKPNVVEGTSETVSI